jgi:hypothetical protein
LFVSAAIATLNRVKRFRLDWVNGYDPSLQTLAVLGVFELNERVMPEFYPRNLSTAQKSAVEITAPLEFVRVPHDGVRNQYSINSNTAA